MSYKLVFFGNERLATGIEQTKAPVLKGLIDAGYDVAAVVVSQKTATSRKSRSLEVEEIASRYKIPLLAPAKPSEIIRELGSYDAVAGTLAAYGRILPQQVIDIFPKGIINLHPSLLPIYRGPTPIEQAILDGAPKTGASIMSLTAGMDDGPVYAQEELSLSGSESKTELADKLNNLGAQLFLQVMPAVLSGNLVAQPQDGRRATYTKLIKKDNGNIDWNLTAQQIERQIRAFLNWPGSHTQLLGKEVIITTVSVDAASGKAGEIITENGQIRVYCGQGSILVNRLKPAGKPEMDARAFLSGVRT